MAIDPSNDAATRFASAAEPLLGPLEEQWILLREKPSNLALLVSVLERFSGLRQLAADAGEEIPYQLSRGCEEMLSGVLCDQFQNPQPALDIVHESLSALRKHIAGRAEARTTSVSACAPLMERMFQLLKALLAQIHAPETAPASLPGTGGTEEGVPAGAVAPAPPLTDEEHASSGVPKVMEEPGAYREFVSESGEHLDKVEEKLLALETRPEDMDLIDGIFRSIHSIKGGAGCLGLTGIEKLAHDTETLLENCRKKTLSPTSEVIEICLRSVDTLRRLGANLNEALQVHPGESATVDIVVYGPLRREIRRLLEQQAVSSTPPISSTSSTLSISSMPQAPTAKPPTIPRLGDILMESGDITAEDLERALSMQDLPVGEILVEMGRITPDRVEKALARQREAGGPGMTGVVSRAIRVDTGRIDDLIALVGKLASAKEQVLRKARALPRGAEKAGNQAWEESLARLTRITKDLQDRSMALRMTPIRQVFQKMTRVVREANKKMNKNVRLVITGEALELDRAAVEQIADPLVHLVRNCLDHGIETVEERRAAGKPEEGTVTLDARRQGDNIAIRVEDDGHGLNREHILAKAVELGLLKEGANPPDAELHGLIFMPGFTTARVVTDLSGRGVGLDVVKRNVEKLNGRLETASQPGKGTTFTISLPLSLVMIGRG